MAIHIIFTGECENCKCADLELEKLDIDGFRISEVLYSVRCTHEDACAKWEEYLKETFERMETHEPRIFRGDL